MKRPSKFLTHLSKLCLNLAILVASFLLIRFGYELFANGHNTQIEAIKGSSIVIGGIVGIILLAKLSTHGGLRYAQPGFKITILSMIGILLIFGFAGVEPIARYLRSFANTIDPWISWAKLGWEMNLFFATISPLYAILFLAVIVWIIYTIRHS